MDFTDLYKACPKDPFLVLNIDQLVDATYRHPQMGFLDDFQGYHHIALALEDEEKTYFNSPKGDYHYNIMPFRLKNAKATYQHMVTRMFRLQIEKTVEVYTYDMVVKIKVTDKQLVDLVDVFNV